MPKNIPIHVPVLWYITHKSHIHRIEPRHVRKLLLLLRRLLLIWLPLLSAGDCGHEHGRHAGRLIVQGGRLLELARRTVRLLGGHELPLWRTVATLLLLHGCAYFVSILEVVARAYVGLCVALVSYERLLAFSAMVIFAPAV